jgi:hypothetical protein
MGRRLLVVTTEKGFWSDRYVCVLSGTVFGTLFKEGAIAVELCLEKGQVEDGWKVMPLNALAKELAVSHKELQRKLERLSTMTGGIASVVMPSKRQGWQVRVHQEVRSSLSLISEELKRKPEVAIKYLASIGDPVQASTLPPAIADKVRDVLLQVTHKMTSISISAFGGYQKKFVDKSKETIEKILTSSWLRKVMATGSLKYEEAFQAVSALQPVYFFDVLKDHRNWSG